MIPLELHGHYGNKRQQPYTRNNRANSYHYIQSNLIHLELLIDSIWNTNTTAPICQLLKMLDTMCNMW